jgi:NitT/TauT family transport system permease protein/sulfonate transport system permease protein
VIRADIQPPECCKQRSGAALSSRREVAVNSSTVRNIAGFVVFFGLWQLLASIGWINPVLLPSPLQLAAAAYELTVDGILWTHTLASLNRVLTGFALAAVTGITLGVALGWSDVLADLVRPLVESVRPIPPIAWTPIAILWFGVGDAPSYFLVFIGAVFPVFINTFSAVRNIDRVQINAALCLGAKPGLLIRDILIPASLPVIFPGLRIALGVGWMCVVAAELIAAQSGLGYMIQQNRVLLQTQNVVTGMITIGIVGFAMSALMEFAEKRLLPWTERPK